MAPAASERRRCSPDACARFRHVAKMARRRHPDHAVPEDVNGYFAEMGRIALDMGNDARDVVLSGDPSKAAELDDDDDSIDDLHRHLFTMLMNQDWKHSAAAAVDVTLLGRYYERFADHAVEIARRVIFRPLANKVEHRKRFGPPPKHGRGPSVGVGQDAAAARCHACAISSTASGRRNTSIASISAHVIARGRPGREVLPGPYSVWCWRPRPRRDTDVPSRPTATKHLRAQRHLRSPDRRGPSETASNPSRFTVPSWTRG